MLKTTQSGYEGYLRDQYTLLPETRDRIMATSVAATWKCVLPCNWYRVRSVCVSSDTYVVIYCSFCPWSLHAMQDREAAKREGACHTRYSGPVSYDAAYTQVKEALQKAFWGPATAGVYSPSVQYTLFQMGKLALAK